MDLRLALLGCGNVGRAFLALAAVKEADLLQQHDLRLRFTGALTRSSGGWVAPDGVAVAEVAASGWPASAPPAGSKPFSGNGVSFAATCPADVLIELTPLEPLTGEPATGHVRAALVAGRHVVTANKGPIAHEYHALRTLAVEHGVALRFESTVMDGTPLMNLAQFCLPVTRITGFRGALNSTSNYVLGQMAAGQTLEAALEGARALGIAEANPAYDLEGWDAAVKATVLANVLMGADLRVTRVTRAGLGAEAMRAARAALSAGHVLKQIVQARRAEDGTVAASVELAALPPAEPLAHLTGMETALTLSTDTMGDLTLIEGEGGTSQTAFGVLADIITIARELAHGQGSTERPASEREHGHHGIVPPGLRRRRRPAQAR
jgi:homoserine dehydrogenase